MEIFDSELQQFMEQKREQTDRRRKMTKALKDVVTPLMRQRGFKGTCPHFRRIGQDRTDLFMFFFDKHGDGFVIEIGQCPPDGYSSPVREHIPAEKVKTWDLYSTQRARVQPRPASRSTADWFRYEDAKTSDDFTRTAESVLPFVEQAIAMFDDFEHVPKIG